MPRAALRIRRLGIRVPPSTQMSPGKRHDSRGLPRDLPMTCHWMLGAWSPASSRFALEPSQLIAFPLYVGTRPGSKT
jgi:hypothetical protein